QELVHLLQGKIEVSSKIGEGSTFSVFLPVLKHSDLKTEESKVALNKELISHSSPSITKDVTDNDLPIILIVEDNQAIAKYLQICLEPHYQVLFASNGQEGIDLAFNEVPDLIISDVMMPEKDGFELCETLKEDTRTSHIPLILLTAKADIESKIIGLKYGADDYLAKPFHEEELLVRIQNLLDNRRKLQARYQDLYSQSASTLSNQATTKEDAFIEGLKKIFDEHMNDPRFDLNALSRALLLSRSQLGRKVKALTGKSPAVFLRSLRLQKARHLLLNHKLSVKEVAFEVGFTDPSYFSKSYAEQYGESPSITGKS
nr:response regulator [Saprospiraceae bacterium]